MAEALDVQLRADASAFNRGISDAIGSLNRLTNETKKISNSTQQMASGFQKFSSTVSAAFKGLAIGALSAAFATLGTRLVDVTERAENFRASINALRGSSTAGADAMNRVYQSAVKLGAGVDDVSNVFKSFTLALAPLGASNAEVQRLTETIFKLGRIGGSSMNDIAEGARQLGQAFSSGKLSGDELKSLLERLPLVAQAIAKEMGVTIGQLKKLGSEGKLGPEEVYRALMKISDEVDQKFAKMPLTIGQAMNNVQTAIARAFDNPAIIAGVQAMANAINSFAGYLTRAGANITKFGNDMKNLWASSEVFRLAIVAIAGALTVALIPALTAAGAAVLAFSRAILAAAVANPWIALATLAVGAAVAIITNWDKVVVFFENAVPAGLTSLVQAYNAAMAALVKMTGEAWQKIEQTFINGINTVIEKINGMIQGVNSSLAVIPGGFAPVIPEINKVSDAVNRGAEAWKGYDKAAVEAGQKASFQWDQYKTKLAALSTEQQTTADSAANLRTELEGLGAAAGSLGGAGGGAGGGKGGGGGGGSLGKAADGVKKLGQEMANAAAKPMQDFAQGLQQIAQSAASGLVDAMFSIAEGSKSAAQAFGEMAKSMLKQIAQLIVQMLILKPLMNAIFPGAGLAGGGGGGIGLFSGGAAALGTFSAANSRTAIGNYQGFAPGPSVMQAVRSSSVTASSSKPLMVSQPITINNNSDAVVRTRQDQTGTIIDIAIEAVTDQIVRGGNRLDQAMSRAYGARRVGY